MDLDFRKLTWPCWHLHKTLCHRSLVQRQIVRIPIMNCWTAITFYSKLRISTWLQNWQCMLTSRFRFPPVIFATLPVRMKDLEAWNLAGGSEMMALKQNQQHVVLTETANVHPWRDSAFYTCNWWKELWFHNTNDNHQKIIVQLQQFRHEKYENLLRQIQNDSWSQIHVVNFEKSIGQTGGGASGQTGGGTKSALVPTWNDLPRFRQCLGLAHMMQFPIMYGMWGGTTNIFSVRCLWS